MKVWIRGSICAVVLTLGGSGGPLPATPEPAWLARFNQERARFDATPLRPSALLAMAAQEQAEEMAAAARRRSLSTPSNEEISAILRRVGYAAHFWSEESVVFPEGEEGRHLPLRLAVEEQYREVGVGTAYLDGHTLQVFLFATQKREIFAPLAARLADRRSVEGEMLARVNAVRRQAGLAPLTLSPLLDRASQRHADDMLRRAYFDHRSPEGLGPTERARAEGYRPGAGENLVEGRFTPEEALRAWLDSPPHRRNLLDPGIREIGLGVGLGPALEAAGGRAAGAGAYRVVWVLLFGTGMKPAPEPSRPFDAAGEAVVVEDVVVVGGR